MERSISADLCRSLLDRARGATEFSCAPYSGLRVGAALLSESGAIYTGVNVESSSFGGTICAERTALVKALSEGERTFTAIAVTTSEGERITPCGICRQLLFDYAPGLIVVLEGNDGAEAVPLSDLLPDAFVAAVRERAVVVVKAS